MATAAIFQFLSNTALGLNFTKLLPLVLLFVAFVALKRHYLSPISDIPGHFFAPFSVFWKLRHIIKGHIEEETIALHKKHDI